MSGLPGLYRALESSIRSLIDDIHRQPWYRLCTSTALVRDALRSTLRRRAKYLQILERCVSVTGAFIFPLAVWLLLWTFRNIYPICPLFCCGCSSEFGQTSLFAACDGALGYMPLFAWTWLCLGLSCLLVGRSLLLDLPAARWIFVSDVGPFFFAIVCAASAGFGSWWLLGLQLVNNIRLRFVSWADDSWHSEHAETLELPTRSA